MLTTNQKGLVAETAVMHECAKAGIGVSRPLDDERYDLILDLRPRLLRVQCKWASTMGDGLAVRLYSSRRGRDGLIRRTYTRDEIDAFVAYSAETDRCYLLDGAEVAGRNAGVSSSRHDEEQPSVGHPLG